MLRLILLVGILGFYLPAHAQIDGCLSSSECSDDQCCLGAGPLVLGKRLAIGTCTPRPQSGGKCYVNNDDFLETDDNNIYFYSCPCQGTATCVGTSMFEVPQGEVGTCTV